MMLLYLRPKSRKLRFQMIADTYLPAHGAARTNALIHRLFPACSAPTRSGVSA
jgi:hypothetical protein